MNRRGFLAALAAVPFLGLPFRQWAEDRRVNDETLAKIDAMHDAAWSKGQIIHAAPGVEQKISDFGCITRAARKGTPQ